MTQTASDQIYNEVYAQLGGSGFVYDLDKMAEHLGSLRADGLRLWYACKANPLSAILHTVKESGFSFDVASMGELEQVIRIGADPKKVLVTGPVKTKELLQRALEFGLEWFVLESPKQFQLLHSLSEELGRPVNALLRLQLSWDSREQSVLGGNEVTAFGMDPESWGEVKSSNYVHLRGVHVFQWGNLLEEEKIGLIWKRIAEVAKEFANEQGFPLDILDLGGGLGISYKDASRRVSWKVLQQKIREAKEISGAQEIWLELGRYAVGPFGSYVTQVEERKVVRGKNILLCRGGSHHLVRPALVGESFPAQVLGRSTDYLSTFEVHGPLCTSLDKLGTFSLPETVEAGDLMVFHQAGAYGFTESMPYFLCHDLAGEAVVKGGRISVVRKVENASSWMK